MLVPAEESSALVAPAPTPEHVSAPTKETPSPVAPAHTPKPAPTDKPTIPIATAAVASIPTPKPASQEADGAFPICRILVSIAPHV